MSEKGDRYNTGKPGMHLLPLDALKEVARIYDYGAVKYSPHNWEKGLAWEQGIKASLLRHLADWSTGQDYDDESGLPHDIHIAFNALALVTMRIRDIGEDDRNKICNSASIELESPDESGACEVRKRPSTSMQDGLPSFLRRV